MTTEEKAKAYDKAIKKAKALYNSSETMSGCSIIIETIFPELKESEDEKVKRMLIDYFKEYKENENCGINTFNRIPTDNILSWLEKQSKE